MFLTEYKVFSETNNNKKAIRFSPAIKIIFRINTTVKTLFK